MLKARRGVVSSMAQSDGDVSGNYRWECDKCGAEIRPHMSAYSPWDEVLEIKWTPSSDDEEHTEGAELETGKHPQSVTRRFCSADCLEAFVQMDYSLKARPLDTDT